jgi:hypothetical protein
MAKGKNYPKDGTNKGKVPDDGKRQGPVGVKAGWCRTGGAIGDESMPEMEEFNKRGAGVDEGEKEVGNMPNEGVHLSQLPNRIR